jgi:hypothetical protein
MVGLMQSIEYRENREVQVKDLSGGGGGAEQSGASKRGVRATTMGGVRTHASL